MAKLAGRRTQAPKKLLPDWRGVSSRAQSSPLNEQAQPQLQFKVMNFEGRCGAAGKRIEQHVESWSPNPGPRFSERPVHAISGETKLAQLGCAVPKLHIAGPFGFIKHLAFSGRGIDSQSMVSGP